jgi:hypothetical protein
MTRKPEYEWDFGRQEFGGQALGTVPLAQGIGIDDIFPISVSILVASKEGEI